MYISRRVTTKLTLTFTDHHTDISIKEFSFPHCKNDIRMHSTCIHVINHPGSNSHFIKTPFTMEHNWTDGRVDCLSLLHAFIYCQFYLCLCQSSKCQGRGSTHRPKCGVMIFSRGNIQDWYATTLDLYSGSAQFKISTGLPALLTWSVFDIIQSQYLYISFNAI
jgi:hypothetical protein